jgi:hypothetical protein
MGGVLGGVVAQRGGQAGAHKAIKAIYVLLSSNDSLKNSNMEMLLVTPQTCFTIMKGFPGIPSIVMAQTEKREREEKETCFHRVYARAERESKELLFQF